MSPHILLGPLETRNVHWLTLSSSTHRHHPRYLSSVGQQSSGQGSNSQSTMNATPWGMSQSQSSSSYAYQQSSQVVQSFQPILGMLSQMQGMMASGTMTQTLAASYMSQLASQLQPALLGMNSCGCFGSVCVVLLMIHNIVASDISDRCLG